MSPLRLMLATLLSLSTLAACSDSTPQLQLTDSEKRSVLRLQSPFKTPPVRLPNTSQVFGIEDCHIYQAQTEQGVVTGWNKLFSPAFYPWPQTCLVEKLHLENGYLSATIGTQGLGAGGCCTTYAEYRTTDGISWETRESSGGDWKPLPSSGSADTQTDSKK